MRIIISPSGKLYGSENVLFDYIKHSKLKFDLIFVPQSSPFQIRLEQNNFFTKGFKNEKWLYVKLLFILLTSKVKSVYCNEAGHIRYIYLLALFFPRVKFVVHVRILEDTPRIKRSKKNINFVAISDTIQNGMKSSNHLIYDGYHFSELKNWHLPSSTTLRVGIVGRITASKGISLFTEAFFQNCGTHIEFQFFGDIDSSHENTKIIKSLVNQKNVCFNGFINDKNKIYSSIDVLLHVNEHEPLGRIFFESLDFGIPFIGINKGGIAEIANKINYPYVFDKDELAAMLNSLSRQEWTFDVAKIDNSRNDALGVFSISIYADQMDRKLG